MAWNPVSASRLPADDPYCNKGLGNLPVESGASQLDGRYKTHRSGYAKGYARNTAAGGYDPQTQYAKRPGYVTRHFLNTATGGLGPEAHPALCSGQLPQTPSRTHSSQEMTIASSVGHIPSLPGNPQHQPVLPTAGGDLAHTPTNQQESNLANSPSPRGQISASQPKSVKHLTCWYWANKGCRLPDHVCLYSHFDTGRLAEPPVQIQRGRPAVAGKNATNPRPVYKDWKGHHRSQSAAVVGPQIQKQIEHIYAKAGHPSNPTTVIPKQSETANMVKEELFGSAQPIVNYNRAHPDDSTSPAPADSYRNMSIGIGASNQPVQEHFIRSPPQMGGNFVAPSHAAQYPSGSIRYDTASSYGPGGNYGGMGVNYGGTGGNYGGMDGNYGMGGNGPDPHHFGVNGSNNPNTSMPSGQYGGRSGGSTQEMQKQMKVKDKVITELAGIVEMLEINYGISIDDQTTTFQKFMDIARSMEEEAREAGNVASSSETKGRASNVPAPSASIPSYGHPPSNHERIMTAMEGYINLVQMEKMVLAKSKARKQVVDGDLESIKAAKLLPRRWMER
ncbi:hypothetical protein HO133_009514 [Letharia lupina]|uniref:C3H1-type domain-containing protein n=1 Tax=Letharia lupina TaxID=560253 RepID=A0A8H6FF33_9LECA|nr:uncharacterized protein HO133_009514 [Letharia lupina]KAF6225514.1 hypothetical protein HO133_009514 [Letharia lupina]